MQERITDHLDGQHLFAHDGLARKRDLVHIAARRLAHGACRHAKAFEVVLAFQVARCLLHRRYIQIGMHEPAEIAHEQRRRIIQADMVVVFAPLRIESSTETRLAFLDRAHRDVLMRQRIQASTQAVQATAFKLLDGNVEADHLAKRMHARIRAARAHHLHRPAHHQG